MALTLRSVERRLGLSTTAYIKYYFICDVCWFRHDPDMFYGLESPACTQSDCPGKLYTVKRANGADEAGENNRWNLLESTSTGIFSSTYH